MRPPPPAGLRHNAGFSLVEMLVVVIMLGILMIMAIPRAERATARANIVAARVGFSNLFLRARNTAIQTRQPVIVTFASGTVVASANGTVFGQSTLLLNFQGSYGVNATSSAASLTIQPTGTVSTGTPFTIVLSKAGIYDTVSITGYGRVE